MRSTDWDHTIRMLLEHMPRVDAADLYMLKDSPPVYRIDGIGHPAKDAFDGEQLASIADSLMSPIQQKEFQETHEMNLALDFEGVGRFRASIFRQRGSVGMVFRLVRSKILTLDELKHPQVLKDVALAARGLVLLVGGTGSGKSTTLAAMIAHRNATTTGHIITVEDPIEFIHPHNKCVVTQREVGTDTLSYAAALKSSLRQAPDVILIGEIRDVETMEAAIAFAETGHLCLSTLHANNANQALERILNFFPVERHHEILAQLSMNLRAIISQRLIPCVTGGRAAALEIMLDTPRIKDLIKRGEIDVIKDAMEQGTNEGCQTFDSAVFDLLRARRIAGSDALAASDNPNNLRIRVDRLKGARKSGGTLRLLKYTG